MKHTRATVLLLLPLMTSVLASRDARAELIPSPDGLTVYDTLLQVNWLADANLAGKANADGQFGVQNIGPNGSMDFLTAQQWVKALNNVTDGDGVVVGYLRHTNWSLPASPWAFPNTPFLQPQNIPYDPACSQLGPKPNYASFQWNCRDSALGSLYYQSLQLTYPNTAVPIQHDRFGPFVNFQPYLYWSETSHNGGYNTFSFSTGWEGSNTPEHYMYVLPMFAGRLACTVSDLPPFRVHCPKYFRTGVGNLELSEDGQTIFDPDAVDPLTHEQGVSWLTNANLAVTEKFGAQCAGADNPDHTNRRCINRDGSMTRTTADNWITGMNAVAWLGQTNWQLPRTEANDLCGQPQQGQQPGNLPNFECTGSPMGELFYDQLGLVRGSSVDPTPRNSGGPFRHLQPYLYWSCTAALPPASPTSCDYNRSPDDNNLKFAYSFSFGNGFQGTDVVQNYLYVMVYYPETPAEALNEAIKGTLGSDPDLSLFLLQSTALASAPSARAKAQALATFVLFVDAHRHAPLSAAQAAYFIALARAI